MIDKNKLEEVVADQQQVFRNKDQGIKREIDWDHYLKTKQITVISGIRRCGKSTLLRQLAGNYKDYYYINFDDERLLNFVVSDFDDLMVIFKKIKLAKTIFLDEIQNIVGWERFIRRIHDEGYKIFLTGSNANLLSSELGTRLTGRYIKIELYPFSFLEYLNYQKIAWWDKSTDAKAKILSFFDDYLEHGGFPEYVTHNDQEFLQRIYADILYRDLIARYNIRRVKAFKQLANYVFTNLAKLISYHSLKKVLGYKSVMSVKNGIHQMEESYLLFELHKYDPSLKRQYTSEKKIYVIDNGLRNAVAFYFSEDAGRLLENMVFIELRRRGREVFFSKGQGECDFLVRDKKKISQLIQVSWQLDNDNRGRELSGLKEAMEIYGLREGLILTKNQAEEIEIGRNRITVMPAYKWLLE